MPCIKAKVVWQSAAARPGPGLSLMLLPLLTLPQLRVNQSAEPKEII